MQAIPPPVNTRCLALLAAAFPLLVIAGVAQQAPATTSPSEDKSETVVLSPFVVEAGTDEGYRATSTLAGSRIKTDLKDVASPITVVTKEFFNDVAAVDINDIVSYTAGTEGTGEFTSTSNSLGKPTDDIAANPFGATRIRGLASAQITRDYFHTINNWIGFDTYNLDALTISRGPNSVLAGLGTPAGIINYSPQHASLGRDQTSLSFRYGSYGDSRGVINSNIVLKDDRLAVRLAVVAHNRGFRQEPAYNKDRRLYLATTFKPWQKTTLRAGFEYARVEANNPNSLSPEDGISQWVARGSPVYDSSIHGTTIPAPLSGGANRPVVVYGSEGSLDGWYNEALVARYFQSNLGGVGLFSPLRMNSNRYLNLHKLNLNPSLEDRQFTAFNFSIDQEIARGLYANVSYVNESIYNERLNLFRTEYNVLFVDPNVRLPNGSPNPHFGETYMQFRGLDNRGIDDNSNEVVRGTVTYDLDLRDTNKWLGRYRLTGFAERRETETQGRQWNARVTSDPLAYEDFSYRYYLGGSATSMTSRVPSHPGLVTNVARIGTPTLPSGATSLSSTYALKSDRKRLEKLDSAAAVIQAYWWDDKIVGTYGLRRDTNKAAEIIGVNTGGGIVAPAGAYNPQHFADSKFSDTTATLGVVVHALPWLSVHYNKSENFVPNAGKIDLLGNPTPAPTGDGKDFGFSLNLLDGKLQAKFNWFELTAAGAPAPTFPLEQWTIPFLELTIMPDIASTAAFQADHPGFVYKKAMVDGVVTGATELNGGYTSDQVSKGLEMELTYNVTKNWRLMATVSRQEAKLANIAPKLTEFIEERLEYWEDTGLFNYLVSPGGGWGQTLTGRQYWERDSLGAYIGYRSGEGRPSTQLAEWHASVVTNYAFTEGMFKGFNIGMGARYVEGQVIGNPAILDTAGRVIGLDLDNPYKNNDYVSLDAWIGYRTRIFADKYDLSFQLNIRDLQAESHFRPITANSDGAHAAYRIIQPRTFYLTTKLEF